MRRPTRDILRLLADAPRTTAELAGLRGVTYAAVYQVLGRLEDAGVVRCDEGARDCGVGRPSGVWTLTGRG